jgi:hypothetical protein
VERIYRRIIVLSILIVCHILLFCFCHDLACTDKEWYCGFQSCTILVNVPPGSSSGTCVSPCNGACQVVSIQAEQGTDTEKKVEEVPEPVSFPEIKAEPDEVSYLSVCHHYTIMARLFSSLCYLGVSTWTTPVWRMEISVSCCVIWIPSKGVSLQVMQRAEVSEYILIADQHNVWQNPHPNITIVFCDNAFHLRICNLPLTPESVKNKVNCMFLCLIFLYEMWVLNKVRYSKVSHRISMCTRSYGGWKLMLWDHMPQMLNYGWQIVSCEINGLVTVKRSTGHIVKKLRES